MSILTVKVPAIIVSTVLSLGLGMGIGVVLMGYYSFHYYPQRVAAANPSGTEDSSTGGRGGPPGGMMGRGGPPGGMGGMMGRGGRGGRGGGRGGLAGPKVQLTLLVGKLDQLTDKPLAVTLTEAQRNTLREQLQGIEDLKDLTDEEAKKRLDSLLAVLSKDKETLVAAGFSWPVAGGAPPAKPPANPPANPFQDSANSGHLKSLLERVKKAH